MPLSSTPNSHHPSLTLSSRGRRSQHSRPCTDLYTRVELSARVSSFIPSGLMHIGFYTPWLLCSALCRQRPSGCPSHAWCNCAIQKLCLCRPLYLEPSSA